MILQTVVIVFFVFWAYEEYLNNQYFQDYVNTTLGGGAFAIIAISTVGVFSAVASGLYMKLRNTRRELEQVISTETSPSEDHGSGSVLEPHVQQHIIEMIRKSTPPSTSGSTGMPVLRREDQPSGQAQ